MLSEWVPTIEHSAADLLTNMVYGPIWLAVEPWIEFKEVVKGGVTSYGGSSGSHHRPQGRWRLWLPGNHWGSRKKIVVVSAVCQDRSRVEVERDF